MKNLGILLFGIGMLVAICAGAKLTDHARFRFDQAARKKKDDKKKDDKKKDDKKKEGKKNKKKEDTKKGDAKKSDMAKDGAKKEDGLQPRGEPEKTVFPDTWPIFVVSMLCAIAGIVIWHKESRAVTIDDDTPASENPIMILSAMQSALRKMQHEINGLSPMEMVAGIDLITERYVFPLNLSRNAIIQRLGMKNGAEILVTFAGAERMLNRAWSAASDDHRAEAIASFGDAVQAFADADRLAQKFLAK